MPITLKNANAIPSRDYETVTVLGLEIPKTSKLPYGAQVELIDLQTRYEAGEFGHFEYLMRLFCVFTLRLPKAEHVRWDWLARQDIEAEEVTQLVQGTLALLEAIRSEGEAGSGNAPKKRTGKTAN
jgi:hypothetical protein